MFKTQASEEGCGGCASHSCPADDDNVSVFVRFEFVYSRRQLFQWDQNTPSDMSQLAGEFFWLTHIKKKGTTVTCKLLLYFLGSELPDPIEFGQWWKVNGLIFDRRLIGLQHLLNFLR